MNINKLILFHIFGVKGEKQREVKWNHPGYSYANGSGRWTDYKLPYDRRQNLGEHWSPAEW